jgi:hypothetical protein
MVRFRRILLLCACVFAFITPTVLPTIGASADDPDGGKDVGVQTNQDADLDPQGAYADQLQDLIDSGGISGFAGLAVHGVGDKVTVYWKGTPPQEVQDLVGSWSAPTEFVSTTLNEVESDLVLALLNDAAELFPFDVRTLGLNDSLSKILVGVLPAQLQAATNFLNSAAGAILRNLALPVEFTTVSDDTGNEPFARGNDQAPFWGGGYLDFDDDGNDRPECTTGFKVHSGSGSTYKQYMVTAFHCGATRCYTTTQDVRVGCGTVGKADKTVDVVLLSGKTYGARIFNGQAVWPWNYTTDGANLRVVSSANPARGEHVCLSGAFSGEECADAYVASPNGIYITLRDGTRIGPGYWILSSNGNRQHGFAGPGDSGGPVYRKSKTSSGEYVASVRGMIESGDNAQMPCPGHDYGDWTRICTTQIFVTQVSAIKNKFGVVVTTQ